MVIFPLMGVAVDRKNRKTVTDGLIGGVRGRFFFVAGRSRCSDGEPPQFASLEAFAVIVGS